MSSRVCVFICAISNRFKPLYKFSTSAPHRPNTSAAICWWRPWLCRNLSRLRKISVLLPSHLTSLIQPHKISQWHCHNFLSTFFFYYIYCCYFLYAFIIAVRANRRFVRVGCFCFAPNGAPWRCHRSCGFPLC